MTCSFHGDGPFPSTNCCGGPGPRVELLPSLSATPRRGDAAVSPREREGGKGEWEALEGDRYSAGWRWMGLAAGPGRGPGQIAHTHARIGPDAARRPTSSSVEALPCQPYHLQSLDLSPCPPELWRPS